MPLLVVRAGDRGVLVPVEDLEDSRLLLTPGLFLLDLVQVLLCVGWTLIGHPKRVPSRPLI